jgi:hypothetical protein
VSDGMSDARAEGEIYQEVWNAVYDLREVLCIVAHAGDEFRGLWSAPVVDRVNELIADLGWRFEVAEYAEPRRDLTIDAEKLWDAVASLRLALRGMNVGHRGWGPVVDRTVDGLMRGTGYLFVRFGNPLALSFMGEDEP